jgi:ECF sigma factor
MHFPEKVCDEAFSGTKTARRMSPLANAPIVVRALTRPGKNVGHSQVRAQPPARDRPRALPIPCNVARGVYNASSLISTSSSIEKLWRSHRKGPSRAGSPATGRRSSGGPATPATLLRPARRVGSDQGPEDSSDAAAGLEQLPGREPTPALAAQVADECRRLLEALGDAGLRSIALWKMEGDANSQIAAKLGCALSTVERRLAIIRQLWEKENSS